MHQEIDTEDSYRQFPYHFFGLVSIVTTIIGVIILFNIKDFIAFILPQLPLGENAMASAGQFGDIVGGVIGTIFSLVGVFLVFLTFKKQSDSFRKERFENQFFEMMKIYRDNVNEMTYNSPDEFEKNETRGRKVFVKLNKEFLNLYRFLRIVSVGFGENCQEEDLISMTYLTLFFGLGNEGRQMLSKRLAKCGYTQHYPAVTNQILVNMRRKRPRYWIRSREKLIIQYYGGHQVRLGHYFRHLYQTVVFVHKQDFLTRKEKYDYIKLLRGQMSTFEQAIFFYNSISPFGRIWELKYRDFDYNLKNDPATKMRYTKRGNEIGLQDLLITEYRLIQNIPEGFTDKISPKKYFKKLVFEEDE